MTGDNDLTDDQILKAGVDALFRELGPSGFNRFLQQFSNGSGDYTRDRQALLGNPSVDKLVREIKAMRGDQSEPE